MSIVLEGYTTEEQRSVMRLLLWAKGLNAKDIDNEMLHVYGGKGLSRKAVHNWVKKFSHGHSKVADDETEVRKWLRYQSKLLCCGFDALVKLRYKCITDGGCRKINVFFSGPNITCFTFYIHL
jgi:hypothetical protein